jgi:hypothetical protein
MNVSRLADLNDSQQDKILKQIWSIGDQYLVIIDKTIIQKLGIVEHDITFLEQELRQEDNTILMKIKKIHLSGEKNNR